jgi:hypothetical protein
MTKRFLLFVGPIYDPGGGGEDFESAYETLNEVITAFAPPADYEQWWAHVLDLETGKIVARTWDDETWEFEPAATPTDTDHQ